MEKQKEELVSQLSKNDMKAAFKEAVKEWMNENFAMFGRWSFYSLLAAAFASLVYFIIEIKLKGGP